MIVQYLLYTYQKSIFDEDMTDRNSNLGIPKIQRYEIIFRRCFFKHHYWDISNIHSLKLRILTGRHIFSWNNIWDDQV